MDFINIDDNEKVIIDQIFNLINIYMSFDKEIDLSFIEQVVAIVSTRKKLNSYIKDVKIDNKTQSRAGYNYYTKELRINLNNISNNIFNKSNKKLYIFIEVVISLLHELEHANQEKVEQLEDTLESYILKASNTYRREIFNQWCNAFEQNRFIKEKLLSLKLNLYYRKYINNYIYAPYERLATIKSQTFTLYIIKNFEDKDLYNDLLLSRNKSVLIAYKNKLYPTKFYIEKINPIFNDWNVIEEKSNNMSLSNRVVLGLRIDKEEQNFLRKILKVI